MELLCMTKAFTFFYFHSKKFMGHLIVFVVVVAVADAISHLDFAFDEIAIYM